MFLFSFTFYMNPQQTQGRAYMFEEHLTSVFLFFLSTYIPASAKPSSPQMSRCLDFLWSVYDLPYMLDSN